MIHPLPPRSWKPKGGGRGLATGARLIWRVLWLFRRREEWGAAAVQVSQRTPFSSQSLGAVCHRRKPMATRRHRGLWRVQGVRTIGDGCRLETGSGAALGAGPAHTHPPADAPAAGIAKQKAVPWTGCSCTRGRHFYPVGLSETALEVSTLDLGPMRTAEPENRAPASESCRVSEALGEERLGHQRFCGSRSPWVPGTGTLGEGNAGKQTPHYLKRESRIYQ